MDTFYVQLTILLSLLVGNFLAGLVPLLVVTMVGQLSCCEHFVQRRNRVVSFFLIFGGGVLMSNCFLILIPESRKHFEKHEESHHSTDINHEETFPIPEFVVLCGFFASFAVAEVLHYIMYHFREKDTGRDVRVRFCSCAKRHTECSRTFKADVPDQTMFGLEKKNAAAGAEYAGFSRPTEQVSNMNSNLLQSSMLSQGLPNYGTVTNMTDVRPNTPVPVLTPPAMTANDGDIVIAQQHNTSPNTHSTSNILILGVLSCHTILQGINIGLSTSEPWTLLLVLCLQQIIIAFIIGNVGLSNTGSLWTTLSFTAAISIMSPVGIGITMLIDKEMSNVLIFGIVKGLLCGSLLYFTFYDLLRRRTLRGAPHLDRFSGFSLGAIASASLLYISVIL